MKLHIVALKELKEGEAVILGVNARKANFIEKILYYIRRLFN